MSKLIVCPSCKKQISVEATACPQCGQPITDEIREASLKQQKKMGKGCLWVIAVVLALSVLGSLLPSKNKEKADPQAPVATAPATNEKSTPAPASAPVSEETKAIPYFNMTADDFVANYNKAAAQATSSQRAKIAKQEKDSLLVSVTQSNGAAITTNPQGKVMAVVYIGKPDGTERSAADVIIGMAFAIGGVKPEWPNSRRNDVMVALGIDDGNVPQKAEAILDGVRFHFYFDNETGLLLTMTPVK